MAHNIIRFASTVFGVPQLITPQAFSPIVEYMSKRLDDPDFKVLQDKPTEVVKPSKVGPVASIEISGGLTYKPQYSLSGSVGTSYLGLIEATQEAIDSGAKLIVYEVASGGGEASHMFDTADTIREMLTEANVKSIAYVDTHSGSAAYGLSVVMDEVIIHPSASAGSIGAVVALLNDSKALAIKGYERTFITSTPGKVPIEKDGSFSKGFLDKLQSDVVKLGDEFATHVAKYTGMDKESILALDAQTLDAESALKAGLVNKIMTHRELAAYVASFKF